MMKNIPNSSATTAHRAALRRAELLTGILDRAVKIPGTDIQVGLDPVIGLIPGIGDALSMLISTTIVMDAARAGVSNVVLFRMLSNIFIDSLLGAVPLAGDFFDFAWKANSKNLELLRNAEVLPLLGNANVRIRAMVLVVIGVFALLLAALIGILTFALYNLLS